MSDECISCSTFSVIGESHTVYLTKPFYNSADGKITKDIDRFSFEMDGYDVLDRGLDTQPLVLKGLEVAACDDDYLGGCFEGGMCFPICFNQKFTNKLRFLDEFITLEEIGGGNEEVTISGLGSCIDAVYVIRSFSYETAGYRAYSWTMVLEKVRD